MTILIHSNLSGTELHVPGYQQATDPGAIGAGKYWVDTSGGASSWVLKVRNDADTGWEDVSSSGSNAAQLQGYNVATTAPTDGQILTWDNANSQWEPGGMHTADYDSGWFAVSANNAYTFAHLLSGRPRQVVVKFSLVANPTSTDKVHQHDEYILVFVEYDETNIYLVCKGSTVFARRLTTPNGAPVNYSSGYLRVLAWS